jgi:dTDP-4-dehydrorhamnose 3,5-epimerase
MLLKETEIEGCYLIELNTFTDDRGWFSRLFCKDSLAKLGLEFEIKQINQSFNAKKHTFRGMHMQKPPFTEGKIVRCISGEVQDIVLDLRKNSNTFLKSTSFLLSEEKNECLFIPKGLAHGFLTLKDESSLTYFHDTNYEPGSEFCVRYNDPRIRLNLLHDIKLISEKDLGYPLLTNEFKGFEL